MFFDPTAKGWGQKIFSTVDLFQTHIWAIRIRMFHFKNLQTADFENPGYGPAPALGLLLPSRDFFEAAFHYGWL